MKRARKGVLNWTKLKVRGIASLKDQLGSRVPRMPEGTLPRNITHLNIMSLNIRIPETVADLLTHISVTTTHQVQVVGTGMSEINIEKIILQEMITIHLQ